MGIPKVYSFHMTLSYSRDPFCCFTRSQDLRTFFDRHRRAFAHFGGVPMTIVYDRTKTVVRRHVVPGEAVPPHPEAVGFAGHYDVDIDVLAAHRPTPGDRCAVGALRYGRSSREGPRSRPASASGRAGTGRHVPLLRHGGRASSGWKGDTKVCCLHMRGSPVGTQGKPGTSPVRAT
ncbi:DDE-type integrase/transposase/recombinase [Streptomyces roseicoloratus]|uniref:DDE-type integrase/transposase/recombinase n=1 Tax=Streptomyces roseicoloratus TaxID=2508722 RepID=UPI003CCC70C0